MKPKLEMSSFFWRYLRGYSGWAMLAAAGVLNRKAGGESVVVPVDADLVDLLYDPAQWQVTLGAKERDRRSIYLIAKRNLRLPFGQAFDQPDLQTSCPRRETSTHALQALEMLNGKTANRLAEAFADRLEREAGDDHDGARDARDLELDALVQVEREITDAGAEVMAAGPEEDEQAELGEHQRARALRCDELASRVERETRHQGGVRHDLAGLDAAADDDRVVLRHGRGRSSHGAGCG